MEAAHVDEAVNDGWSWQRIADSLGVTRQAAHARHARRRRQAKGRLVVAGRARRVVRRAREEAARMGAETLETDHLLLGLLLDPEDGPVKAALDACGISYDEVHARPRAAGGPRASGGRPAGLARGCARRSRTRCARPSPAATRGSTSSTCCSRSCTSPAAAAGRR